jgi:SAM-dependent methyltransferase
LLNLGCGADSHPAFVNVDLLPGPGVIGHDLRKGIPFPDQTYDLVYHSTMLSHLRPADAASLTRECYRVLKPGGILRVVTEDLEQMCRLYLQKLERAWEDGGRESEGEYDWMVLELYDQAIRETPGGGMAEFAKRDPMLNEKFVRTRVGVQGEWLLAGARRSRARPTRPEPTARQRIAHALARAKRRLLTRLLGAEDVQALDLGRFRLKSGQVSYRMYDRFSLKRLFESAGFTEISTRSASESGLDAWSRSNLDLADGRPARPHTLIMEGTRPRA